MGPEMELGNLVSHPDYVLIVIPTWLSKQYMSTEKEKSVQCRKEVKLTPTKHQSKILLPTCGNSFVTIVVIVFVTTFWCALSGSFLIKIYRWGQEHGERQISNLRQVSKPRGQDSSPLCPRFLYIQWPSTFMSLNLSSVRHPMCVHAWKFL